MIIIFPMLVSQSVSENAIPGIAKTIEGYLIVNKMNEIMSSPEVKKHSMFKSFNSRGKLFVAKEGVYLTEEDPWDPGTKGEPEDEGERRTREKEEREKAKEEREKEKHDLEIADKELELKKKQKELEQKRRKETREEEKERRERQKHEDEEAKKRETKASAKITNSDYKSIALEPSFIQVEVALRSGAVEKRFVGIKVVPYRVKSETKLSHLILHDIQLKNMNASLVARGRKVMRWFYGMVDKWRARLKLGGAAPSGDPKRDIIRGRTGHKGPGFVVLSKNEDLDSRLLSNISKINRLFKMGWGNIVVADDIQRQAYFCMAQFRGMCTVLSYSMMYQNVGQLKVYESLEDAKRQNSSLFKVSRRASKVFAEWISDYRQFKYYISEDE